MGGVLHTTHTTDKYNSLPCMLRYAELINDAVPFDITTAQVIIELLLATVPRTVRTRNIVFPLMILL